MKPKPLSLTSRLIVPFMGAAIPISLKCESNALSQDKWLIGAPTRSRRTVVGADERRLADREARVEYTLFSPPAHARGPGAAGVPFSGFPTRRLAPEPLLIQMISIVEVQPRTAP